MRKFLKSLWHCRTFVQIRNFFGIKPQHRKWHYLEDSFSSTDAFFWRVDKDFKTIFRYSDIFGKYFDEKSKVLFIFLDSEGNHLISKTITFSRSVQTLVVDQTLLNSEGFGSFFAYNIPDNPNKFKFKVTNRCYTGFSFKSNGPSFVHGNSITRYLIKGDMVKDAKDSSHSAIFDHSINSCYAVQKDFCGFDRNELFFFNPMKRDLIITIDGSKHLVKSLCTKIVEFKGESNQITKIYSNYNFARPIIFSYKNEFLDVHHA